MTLAEELARAEYEDWVTTFPGSPKSHGFGDWSECSDLFRQDKIARMERTLGRLADRLDDSWAAIAIRSHIDRPEVKEAA